jgi:carboxyl-terminal processing protease
MLLAGAVLLGFAGAALVRYLIWGGRAGPRAADLLPAGAVAAAVLFVRASIERSPLGLLFSLPALLTVGVLFLLTLHRLVRGRPAPPGATGLHVRRLLAVAGLLALAFSTMRTVQFERRRASSAAFAAPLRAEVRSFDLRGVSWSQAFGALVDRLSAEYPFTEWKGIDWTSLRAEFASRIAAAEAGQDSRAYYRALRELAWRIPDGHVDLAGDDHGLRLAEVGGAYGLDLAELSDGRMVAQRVAAGGPAALAGIRSGAEVLVWGGKPAVAAVESAPFLWSDAPPATAEGRRRWQLYHLTRAPVGASVALRWRNPSDDAEERVLVAVEEPERLPANQAAEILFGCAVEWHPLDGGLGYVKVKHEVPTPRCVAPEAELGRALTAFQRDGMKGLILDVRGNFGGEDATAARLLGFFVEQEHVYERVGLFVPARATFDVAPGVELRVTPAQPQWRAPVVVLVDGDTVSSGEGLPLVLKGRPNVVVLGTGPTHGSFAINQKEVLLPGELTFVFPQARSLDREGRIQVDSDASGRGGVDPDQRVERDERALEFERGGGDYVLERARELLALR